MLVNRKLAKIGKRKQLLPYLYGPYKVMDYMGYSEGDMEEVFVCYCNSLDHAVQFYYSAPYDIPGTNEREPAHEDGFLYVHPILEAWEGFWLRLRRSVKLVFGDTFNKDEEYGLFQSLCFRRMDLDRLQGILGRMTQKCTDLQQVPSKIGDEYGTRWQYVEIIDNPYLLRFGISSELDDEKEKVYDISLFANVNVDPAATLWQRMKVAWNYLFHEATRQGHSWDFVLDEHGTGLLRGLVNKMQELFKMETKDAEGKRV